LITAYASVETAVEAMKMGAYDYVTKPFKIDELQMTIQRALDYQAALRENTYLRKELKNRYRFENIIGTSRAMQQVYNIINKVADTDSTVLIQGESGTGKELVARGLHFNSNRQHHPFVAINCSALPENLLESELFGHKKGAFTGAVADKRGLFEEANLGTIFLDEVNSMAPPLQTKLLRVLQEREVRRVGDNKSFPVNVRVVGATNEVLQGKMKDGTFREDLYYRLAVIPIEIPPLRDRLEDVPLLVNHFLQKQASATGGEPKKIDAKAVDILCHYDYPGNVRELENAIERACALCDDEMILPSDLPPQIVAHAQGEKAEQAMAAMPVGQTLDEFIQQQERGYIEATLTHAGGSREKAASLLGISMATLYRKVEPKSKK
jgi:DNA-binding NtrC family response regulator